MDSANDKVVIHKVLDMNAQLVNNVADPVNA